MDVSCRRVVSGIAAVFAVGCHAVGPDEAWDSQPASFGGIPASQVIAMGDTVSSGDDVQVIVSSFGSGSCTRRNGVSFAQSVALVRVTQRVLVRVGDVNCTDDRRQFPETLRVRFTTPGSVVVRAIGRRPGPRGDLLDSIERRIVVR